MGPIAGWPFGWQCRLIVVCCCSTPRCKSACAGPIPPLTNFTFYGHYEARVTLWASSAVVEGSAVARPLLHPGLLPMSLSTQPGGSCSCCTGGQAINSSDSMAAIRAPCHHVASRGKKACSQVCRAGGPASTCSLLPAALPWPWAAAGMCWPTWKTLRVCGAATASGSWALVQASSATALCGVPIAASRTRTTHGRGLTKKVGTPVGQEVVHAPFVQGLPAVRQALLSAAAAAVAVAWG